MTSPRATAAARILRRWCDPSASALAGGGAIAAAILLAPTALALGADAVAPAAPVGMAVTAAKAKNACFSDTILVVGTVVPRDEILVRPDREGLKITEILAHAGDGVSANQVLARLAAPNDQGASDAIHAPAGGTILTAPTVVGEAVSARGEPLFRIVAEGDLEMSAEVPAKDASRLAAGQKAKVKIAGMGESPGLVRSVSATVDPATQLGHARISLEHNPLMRVGAFARAAIDAGESCAVSIPLSALLFGPEGAVVQVIRDNRIETHRVKTGLFAQSNVQIREGLAAGDVIVVRAGAFLRDGDRVRPVLDGE